MAPPPPFFKLLKKLVKLDVSSDLRPECSRLPEPSSQLNPVAPGLISIWITRCQIKRLLTALVIMHLLVVSK